MYYFKLFDTTLFEFELKKINFSWHATDIRLRNYNKNLFPEILKSKITDDTILSFLKTRVIPKNRAFVQNILETNGLDRNDTKGIIDICKGLSLNDSYWVVDDDSLKFDDYNLYDNEFSETLATVAFTGYSSKIKGIATSPEFTTNGVLPKAWRRMNDVIYLFKGGTDKSQFSNAGNEPYSEFYASQVAKKMGINYVEYGLVKWKGILASTCPLFTSKHVSYVPIYLATNSQDIGTIWNWCKERGWGKQFADMIAFDSLIINTDRHFGNFGILKNSDTGEYIGLSPVFDNGEGLLSKARQDYFADKETLDTYIHSDEMSNSAYGISFTELVSGICGKEQIAELRKLANFKFNRHEKYNLDENRLSLLEGMIRSRSIELINVIENPIELDIHVSVDVSEWEKLYPVGTTVLYKEFNEIGVVEGIDDEGLLLKLEDNSYITVHPIDNDIEVVKQVEIHS